MKKTKEFLIKNKEKIFVITFTILYAIITAILAFHHENWRDENQVWLLCKNLSFKDLIIQLKYEGHPIVWFALVYPFVQLGASCKIVNILSWIVMVISVYIILKKAPFNKIAKLAIIITVPFMYQYVIVGRNYSLIVLFVTLLCVLDNNKKQHPIIYAIILGLLANTHLIMVGLVCMITITFYLYELIINKKNNTKEENIKILKGFLIVVLSGVILLIQVARSLTVASELPKEFNIISLLQNAILNLTQYASSLIYISKGSYIINILFLVFISVGVWDFRKETIIFLGSVFFQCIIFAVLGIAESYMAMSVLLILVYVMWSKMNSIKNNTEVKDEKQIKNDKNIILMFEVMLIIISIMSISTIVNAYVSDYKYNYSSSAELADYINNNLKEGAICIADKDAQASSIIPYIKNNAKFWNIRTQEYYTYVTWNWDREKTITGEEVQQELIDTFSESDNLYYIYCTRRKDNIKPYFEEKGELIELYKTKRSLMDETYIIYKIELNYNVQKEG